MCRASCVLQSGSCGLVIKLLLRNDIIRPPIINPASFCRLLINFLIRNVNFLLGRSRCMSRSKCRSMCRSRNKRRSMCRSMTRTRTRSMCRLLRGGALEECLLPRQKALF